MARKKRKPAISWFHFSLLDISLNFIMKNSILDPRFTSKNAQNFFKQFYLYHL